MLHRLTIKWIIDEFKNYHIYHKYKKRTDTENYHRKGIYLNSVVKL